MLLAIATRVGQTLTRFLRTDNVIHTPPNEASYAFWGEYGPNNIKISNCTKYCSWASTGSGCKYADIIGLERSFGCIWLVIRVVE